MFRKISLTIALQFTACIAALLIVNGLLFLFVDYGKASQLVDRRLNDLTQHILQQGPLRVDQLPDELPVRVRYSVRVMNGSGVALFMGEQFTDVPFDAKVPPFSSVTIQGEHHRLMTVPISLNGDQKGVMQVISPERLNTDDLWDRIVTFLMTSGLISIFIFLLALFFARRSLKPAEEMVERLEQFTQDASHELRTPLAIVNSSLDIALKTEQYRDGILSAKDDLKRINALVDKLLELARIDSLAMQHAPVDLSALTERVTADCALLAKEKHLHTVTHIDAHVGTTGDETLLTQLISNLLSNAVKFTPANGTITVSLSKKALHIADTGIGIAPAALPSIFDRFYRADASRTEGGFGLGLSLVKRIAQLHGWTVAVESVQGKGSTFIVTFS